MKFEQQVNNQYTDEAVTTSFFDWLKSFSLQDLFSSHNHSDDFNGSRAEYITVRVRLLAFIFAVLAPLWIPIDYFILPEGDFVSFLLLRLAFTAFFLLLGFWSSGPHNLFLARLRLVFFLAIPSLFYIASRCILGESIQDEGAMIGYSFLPYLLAVFMAIFPLTLLEGVAYAVLIGITFVSCEFYLGNLFTLVVLGDVWLLGLLAGIAVWAQLAQLYMLLRLYREATRDVLTGLVNRRVLTKWLDLEILRTREEKRPLSILLFDLDRFKRINDTYGHLTGDHVLQTFARILESEFVNSKYIGRYGGEEFLAILPEQNEEEAMAAAERVRIACHDNPLQTADGKVIKFSVSIGVAELRPEENADALLLRVDKGLYHAKESGRDLVARSA